MYTKTFNQFISPVHTLLMIGSRDIFLLNERLLIFVPGFISIGNISINLKHVVRHPFKVLQWRPIRWLFVAYVTYHVVKFGWNRNQVHKHLTKKKDELLDRHGTVHAKLLDTETPKVACEQVKKWTLSDLRDKLLAREIAAVDLLDAYQRRVLELSHRHPGCVCEIIFESDVYAILADTHLESEAHEDLTPIHGIPISVQEIFPVRGYDHTLGYTCCTNQPAEDDCALVAALKDAGAIPFVLTNVRQKLLGFRAENPIFGHARHPTHPGRSCVSGDGLLLHHHGTPLSFAADILGEARLTAAACGLAAFKPSTGRMSQKGLDLPIRLPPSLGVVATPIAHSVDDIVSVFRSLWTKSLFKQDASICPMTFDEIKFETISKKKLRLGYYTGFSDLMPASPAVERVMQETRRFLEREGHEVVDFTPPTVGEAYELVMSIMMKFLIPQTLDLVYLKGHGDIMAEHVQRFLHLLYILPSFMRKAYFDFRISRARKYNPVMSHTIRGMRSNYRYFEFERRSEEYARLFCEEWEDAEIDCLVCPVSPLPPVWEDSGFDVVNCVLMYTAPYNLLGYPVGCVRAGRVEKMDTEAASEAVSASRNVNQLSMIAREMANADGLPINIQVVGKPWQDELALGLLKQIDDFMNPPF